MQPRVCTVYTAMTSGLYQATWSADSYGTGASIAVEHGGIFISGPNKVNVSIWLNIDFIL